MAQFPDNPNFTGFNAPSRVEADVADLPYVGEIPKERYGVYMGIINMMIVIPMLIQTLSFGYILKNFLNNDPGKAITFAGVLLLLAAAATLLIKAKPSTEENNNVVLMGGGH